MIRKANINDLDKITEIYNKTHDLEEAGLSKIGWIRNVYPTKDTARVAIEERKDMFVYENKENIIIACAIINQLQVDCYKDAKWQIPADDDKVLVLHTLVVDPDSKGLGIGKEFVSFYEKTAKEMECKALRMDTNEINLAARAMYSKLGFNEIGIVPTVFNNIPNVNLVLLEKKVECFT